MGKNIVKAASLVLVINICVKLLGFVREMAIAAGFGASAASDAYVVAYAIPYLLQTVMGYALVSAILPLLSRYWRADDGGEEAFRIGSTLINLVTLSMLALSLLGIVVAPQLVWLTAPQLVDSTARLAAELMRIILPSLAFMSAGMVFSGILNSRYRFAAVAVAPGVVSLAVIISAMIFAHGNVYVLAIGTLVGFVGFCAVQGLDLPHSGFRYRLVCDFRHPAVRQVLKDIVPIMLGMSVTQIYVIINRIFASGLAEGSISALNYASKLMNLPPGLFVVAIITAIFPRLSELARQADRQPLAQSVSRGVTMTLLVSVPSAVGLMLLDQPLVQLLFQSGSFDAHDTAITAQALFAMCPGMIFLALTMLLLRVFYAMGNVRTPLYTGAASLVVNVTVSAALIGPLGHVGLAWANSIAMLVNAMLLAWKLHSKLNYGGAYLLHNGVKILLGSLIMGSSVWLTMCLWPQPDGRLALAVLVLAAVLVGVMVYFILLRLLKATVLTDILHGWRAEKRND